MEVLAATKGLAALAETKSLAVKVLEVVVAALAVIALVVAATLAVITLLVATTLAAQVVVAIPATQVMAICETQKHRPCK